MKLKHLFSLITIYCFVCIQCTSETADRKQETYYLLNDTCQQIHIHNDSISFINSCLTKDSGSSIILDSTSGKVMTKCEKMKFIIDSIDANDGRYIRTMNLENNTPCNGFHMIKNGPYLSLTTLKSLEGIQYHFMSPIIYSNSLQASTDNIDELIIQVPTNMPINKVNYVAFDQKNGEPKRTIVLDTIGFTKSNIVINPILYGLKKYRAEIVDNKGNVLQQLPILYHADYGKMIREINEVDYSKFLNQFGITDKYLLVYRFNPGRKRVVNKLFNESIEGQVQGFEIRRYDAEMKTF